MWREMSKVYLTIYSVIVVIASIGITYMLSSIFEGGAIIIFFVSLFVMFVPALGIGLLTEIAEDINIIASNSSHSNSYGTSNVGNYSNGGSSLLKGFGSEVNNGFWTCGRCGAENSCKNMYCEGCGNKRP